MLSFYLCFRLIIKAAYKLRIRQATLMIYMMLYWPNLETISGSRGILNVVIIRLLHVK